MRSCIGLALSGWLVASCTTTAPPRERVVYETAKVATAVGCVVDRPADVIPLNQRIPAETWAQRPPGAKAQSVKAQAWEVKNFAAKLKAATSGCKDAPPPAP